MQLKGRVLVVDHDESIRQLVKEHLEADGLEVAEAPTGRQGLDCALRSIPQAVLVSTSLPDIPGIEVIRRLRQVVRTQHIFAMLVGDKDDRAERLAGLEAGASDFVSGSIDIDLVMLRIRNAIQRANQNSNTDPVTGMPAGRGVQDQLMRLVRDSAGTWAVMHVRVRDLAPFREVYGFMAGDDLLRSLARIVAEVLGRYGVENDFLGYGGHDDFIVIADQSRSEKLIDEILAQFYLQVGSHYGFRERERGCIEYEGHTYPLASLRISRVTPEDGPFYDIRSLSEALAG